MTPGETPTPDWAAELLAASQVTDLARDPDDFRVTRQSKVTIGGLLVPVGNDDRQDLASLFALYRQASQRFVAGGFVAGAPLTGPFAMLTATMQKMIERSTTRAKGTPDFSYISVDPRDYTIFSAPNIPVPVVCIHTRPERCWFLGIMRFETALGLSLGRMRVMRPTDKGMYPVTIRTKWRALTNKVKQEEVRDAYQRLLRPTKEEPQ